MQTALNLTAQNSDDWKIDNNWHPTDEQRKRLRCHINMALAALRKYHNTDFLCARNLEHLNKEEGAKRAVHMANAAAYLSLILDYGMPVELSTILPSFNQIDTNGQSWGYWAMEIAETFEIHTQIESIKPSQLTHHLRSNCSVEQSLQILNGGQK